MDGDMRARNAFGLAPAQQKLYFKTFVSKQLKMVVELNLVMRIFFFMKFASVFVGGYKFIGLTI